MRNTNFCPFNQIDHAKHEHYVSSHITCKLADLSLHNVGKSLTRTFALFIQVLTDFFWGAKAINIHSYAVFTWLLFLRVAKMTHLCDIYKYYRIFSLHALWVDWLSWTWDFNFCDLLVLNVTSFETLFCPFCNRCETTTHCLTGWKNSSLRFISIILSVEALTWSVYVE